MPQPIITDTAREQFRDAVERALYPNGEFSTENADKLIWPAHAPALATAMGVTPCSPASALGQCDKDAVLTAIGALAETNEHFFHTFSDQLKGLDIRIPFYNAYNDALDAKRGPVRLTDVPPFKMMPTQVLAALGSNTHHDIDKRVYLGISDPLERGKF